MYVVVSYDLEYRFEEYKDLVINKLKTIVEHELVHREQYSKVPYDKLIQMFKKLKDFKAPGLETDVEKRNKYYYSENREIMAYAKNFSEYLFENFGKHALDIIRFGVSLKELKIYSQLDTKVYHRFMKLVYQYLIKLIK